MMTVRILFSILISISSLLGACHPDSSPPAQSDRRLLEFPAGDAVNWNDFSIRGGNPISSEVYPFVGALVLRLANGKARVFCSGALLGPKIVLTAGHCVESGGKLLAAESLGFSLEAKPVTAMQSTAIQRYIRHPDYRVNGNVEHDYAVLLLKKPLMVSDYAHLQEHPPFADGTPARAAKVEITATAVGYGHDENGRAGVKRMGTSVFDRDRSTESHLFFTPGKDNQIACPGDSGGPLIANGRVIGLASTALTKGVGSPAVVCQSIFGLEYASVHSHFDWIQGTREKLEQGIGSSPWQNPNQRFDVSNDGKTTALDALLVINFINENSSVKNMADRFPGPPLLDYLDVDGDGGASALDALLVINELTRMANSTRAR